MGTKRKGTRKRPSISQSQGILKSGFMKDETMLIER